MYKQLKFNCHIASGPETYEKVRTVSHKTSSLLPGSEGKVFNGIDVSKDELGKMSRPNIRDERLKLSKRKLSAKKEKAEMSLTG